MKVLSLFLVLIGFLSQSVIAGCGGESFSGRVEFINVRGSCDTTYSPNEVIESMIALAKADANQHANFRFMYFGGATRKSEFKITCEQTGQTAEVVVEAIFGGQICH